jgi:acetyl esterase/lipase
MDIYIPSGLSSPAPVIVFIHGGGWSSGSKGPVNIPFFQQSFNSGFVCADINYRLSGDSIWPAQIEDCKTAIRFLKANASLYNLDTCNFGVIGESAGGHLASMIGTSAGVKSLEGFHLGSRNQTSRVKAVVDLYGPTDFLKEDGYYPVSCGSNGLIHNYNSYETNLLGVDFLTSHPGIVSTANPITYISADDAKFFIIHGKDDCVVPSYQSTLLNDALYSANIPADDFIIAEGQSHSDPYFSETPSTILYNNFFLKYLLTPCTETGISESIFRNISVFPNPATDEIKFDLKIEDSYTVEIINTNGITVLYALNQKTLNISGLRSGVYFFKLISSNEIYIQKIIKI